MLQKRCQRWYVPGFCPELDRAAPEGTMMYLVTPYLVLGIELVTYLAKCHPIPDVCKELAGTTPEPPADWMEMEVIMGFRVWQLMFLAMGGFITVVVLLCCFMKCRVPRTKQEIEADFKRKQLTKRFRFLLDKVHIEDTSLRAALERVTELYRNQEKKVKRIRKKREIQEEEVEGDGDVDGETTKRSDSFGSSELFFDVKLTLMQRIKNMIKRQREDSEVSEGEASSKRSDEDQMEAKAKTSDSDEEEEDDEVNLTDSRTSRVKMVLKQGSNESQGSSESQKKGEVQLVSSFSLLQDSPPKFRESASRLTLLQESPPPCSSSWLEDTSPKSKTPSLTNKRKTGSEESEKSLEHQQRTDSQESRDSRKETSGKKESESLDSNFQKNPIKVSVTWKGWPKIKRLREYTQEPHDQTSSSEKHSSQDSQDIKSKNNVSISVEDSDKGPASTSGRRSLKDTREKKSDSQESSSSKGKQKSDSVESTKKLVQTKTSKGKHRSESQSGKGKDKASQESTKSRASSKETQSRDSEDMEKEKQTVDFLESEGHKEKEATEEASKKVEEASNAKGTMLKDYVKQEIKKLPKETKKNNGLLLALRKSKDLKTAGSGTSETPFLGAIPKDPKNDADVT